MKWTDLPESVRKDARKRFKLPEQFLEGALAAGLYEARRHYPRLFHLTAVASREYDDGLIAADVVAITIDRKLIDVPMVWDVAERRMFLEIPPEGKPYLDGAEHEGGAVH